SPTMVIKAATEPSVLMPQIRRAVREIDPDIAIGDARPLEQIVDASIAGRRCQMQLFIAFGGVALFIATLGVWAGTSYGVSRRRREMNIRVALGAQRSQVIRLVLGQVTVPIVVGLGVGTLAALSLGAVVASLLFDVRARDPIVLGSVVSLVAVVGLATCALAARQGLRIDPASALRDE